MIREYRVKPVTRFIVTEWTEDEGPSGGRVSNTRCMGEFDNPAQAEEVAHALATANGGYVQAHDAPALSEGHAIFASLSTYVGDDGAEIKRRPA